MKQRNPEATCATCPYWGDPQKETLFGGYRFCTIVHQAVKRMSTYSCECHPDFFLDEAQEIREEEE